MNVSCYSADSSMLAAATTDGVVIVWSTSDNTKLHMCTVESKAAVTSLSWYKHDKLLYATNQVGSDSLITVFTQ